MAYNIVDGVDFSKLASAVAVSAGPDDAGKLPKLNAAGKLDLSFMQETVDTDKLLVPSAVDLAAVPDSARLYARSFGNAAYPAFIGPIDPDGGSQYPAVLQSAFFNKRTRVMYAVPGSAVPDGLGWRTAQITGSQSIRAITAGTVLSEMARVGWTTGATAGSYAGVYTAMGPRRGTQASGGFFFHTRFGIATAVAASRFMIGLTDGGTFSSAVEPTAWTGNNAFFTMNSTDTNMKFMHKPAGGTNTIVDLGSGLAPKTAGTVLELFITARAGSSRMTYGWRRLDGGVYPRPAYTIGHALANLPTAAMSAWVVMGNGTAASAIGIDIAHMYIEEDY